MGGSPRLSLVAADLRLFLNKERKQYDLLVLDAYGDYLQVPAHLGTFEFFQLLKTRVKPGGIIIVNVIGQRDKVQTQAFLATLNLVFPNLDVYSMRPDNLARQQNFVVTASEGVLPKLQRAKLRDLPTLPIATDDKHPYY